MATYHSGELAVQRRAGVERQASHALRGIKALVPDVAAVFLSEQPMIVVGAADERGRIWASVLTGEPGFLRSPDPGTLLAGAGPREDDPLAGVLRGSARVGMIAIEPATRRRMRLNGTSTPEGDGLRIALDQVISNCPKYLTQRDFTQVEPADTPRTESATELSTTQGLAVSNADTFFIATASADGDADASHRGGNPGFVEVLSPTHLRWPDYVGNAMFLTLGNLEQHAASGLLFLDWETGDVLQVTGTARSEGTTERVIDFFIEQVRQTAGAVPLRWSEPVFSRFNPR